MCTQPVIDPVRNVVVITNAAIFAASIVQLKQAKYNKYNKLYTKHISLEFQIIL